VNIPGESATASKGMLDRTALPVSTHARDEARRVKTAGELHGKVVTGTMEVNHELL